MRVSEILRKLADIVDAEEGIEQADDIENRAAPEPVETDNCDGTAPETMVSPLQQEHELLKKSQGVDNNVSDFAEDEELSAMKKNAGLPEQE